MARKKVETVETMTISFRCPLELKSSLDDLARLSRKDLSGLMVELVGSFVQANQQSLTEYRNFVDKSNVTMPDFSRDTE